MFWRLEVGTYERAFLTAKRIGHSFDIVSKVGVIPNVCGERHRAQTVRSANELSKIQEKFPKLLPANPLIAFLGFINP